MPDFLVEFRRGHVIHDSDPESSLCHCISKDCHLGKGCARSFRLEFGRIEEMKAMNTQVGEACVLEDNHRYIYNLVTKEVYNDRPKFEDLYKSLLSMRQHCFDHDVRLISMPKIGCGRDRFKFFDVFELLKYVFSNTGIMIHIYYF